ncbi:MAG: iron-sulfur cluster assembly scaffold protein, partial [Desulfobacterium sp.]|nr:iron-sulfur cluster assembly scaffold protein [Desulfobacterium sp.]
MYTEVVMDHFKKPRNVGEMKDPDGMGEIGNPVCGDMMNIYIKVKDEIIEDISFQ